MTGRIFFPKTKLIWLTAKVKNLMKFRTTANRTKIAFSANRPLEGTLVRSKFT